MIEGREELFGSECFAGREQILHPRISFVEMHEVIFLHFVLQRFELDHHFLPRLFEPFEAEDFFIERWHGQDGATFGAKVFDDKYAFVNTPDNQANLAAAYKYLNDWWVLAKKAGIPKTDGDAAAPFKEGKIGATFNGNWALGDYQKALGDKLGVLGKPSNARVILGIDREAFVDLLAEAAARYGKEA